MFGNQILDATAVGELLHALADQLAVRQQRFTLAVVGGSALLVLGLASRVTRDVDVVAVLDGDALLAAQPLPERLAEAVRVVARDFGLDEDWLNPGPTALLDFGLPEGFYERAHRRAYGDSLAVLFASRIDQIHLKLYATVDQGAGKHLADLEALQPTAQELMAAARWSRTHDPSEGYRSVLTQVLAHLGVDDAPLDA
ncbi:MAG: DUF6036 family nucleotidyltransferase [Solirubrobacteraceae bacterium MAG38_C4-C5]|nr:DUF6036 family nucleotidyltransferase [Candidatus Siliceabacter maunaloa]